MPLQDDNFYKNGKPKEYTTVIEELQEKQIQGKVEIEYDLELDFEEDE